MKQTSKTNWSSIRKKIEDYIARLTYSEKRGGNTLNILVDKNRNISSTIAMSVESVMKEYTKNLREMKILKSEKHGKS